MTETNEPIKIHRGLKGVYFDRSPCTFIDGRIGELRYRGYSIHDLAENSSFEETAWLLLQGELPTGAQLSTFDQQLKAARDLPPAIFDIIRTTKSAHPMDVVRTAVSALAAFDAETTDNSRDAVIRKAIRLTSQVPMIVAAHARLREGLQPIEPSKELNHAGNLLWMLKGERPSADATQLIDRDLVNWRSVPLSFTLKSIQQMMGRKPRSRSASNPLRSRPHRSEPLEYNRISRHALRSRARGGSRLLALVVPSFAELILM